jgi:hypothetical protein
VQFLTRSRVPHEIKQNNPKQPDSERFTTTTTPTCPGKADCDLPQYTATVPALLCLNLTPTVTRQVLVHALHANHRRTETEMLRLAATGSAVPAATDSATPAVPPAPAATDYATPAVPNALALTGSAASAVPGAGPAKRKWYGYTADWQWYWDFDDSAWAWFYIDESDDDDQDEDSG